MQADTVQQVSGPADASNTEKKKKRYKFKPGTVSIREIRKLQKSTKPLIQKKPFYRLVKEICKDIHSDCKFQQVFDTPSMCCAYIFRHSHTDMCYLQEAIKALQEDGENYLVEYFQRSQKIAIHAGRKTIQIEDTKVS